ncbi:Transposase zinc-ribbon domain-containing protein [Azotobacter beijerinckii]|uniref:Transposase zinc-ribbon domain-containing protein n=1 Tax=Azotobacter beijerinckii TaxID=170623 RepID=A0A1H9K3N5_9GAMM|nr:IS1595 family transposase [Azotobacter beijerinckii]SEQ93712.1 Transposase zinc-ribbon domain-containing protein [Azotobacter beijerinckii]
MNEHRAPPVAGHDYPQTWSQFTDWFHNEGPCLDYLERLRWPQQFICPKFGIIGAPLKTSRNRLVCQACSHQTSVTAGTIFDKTRTPLKVWLAAAWYITNQKHGVSALGLQRVLGLGSYQTAWTLLHRFRRAMIRPGRELLSGLVEVDETYVAIGDKSQPVDVKGRKSRTAKTLVIIAVEMLEPKGFGRIRLRRILDDSEHQVIPFVKDVVQVGATVHTDGSAAYRSLEREGYVHRKSVMLGSPTAAHASMPGVHRVAALIHRWLLGTHQGAVQPSKLDSYLDEFVFRFNRRKSSSRGMLFYRLLEQAVVTTPMTYQNLVNPPKSPPRS